MLLDSSDCVSAPLGSATDLPYLPATFSPGLRKDRVREGRVDI